MLRKCLRGLAFFVLFAPITAHAGSEIFSLEALDAQVDLRTSVVGGEQSWTDGGFGKLRYGGDAGKTRIRARLASVDLAWKPRFNWFASALVSITHQDEQSNDLDLNEAYLKLKSAPGRALQVSGRAGLFWPPVSMEHGGSVWSVTDSITPSAINSWVSEEVKVVGLEATVKHRFGDHELSLTAGVFQNNDTSGTLLSYRGWALHDVRATAFGAMPLPPLSPEIAPYQAQQSYPTRELDKRTGYYLRADWRPPLPFSLYAFRYDNRGNGTSSRNGQTAWCTSFWNVGGAAQLGQKTRLQAQAMWGTTCVGPKFSFGYPVDVRFSSAYLKAVHQIGNGAISGRAEYFRTSDNGFVVPQDRVENGWSAMLAYKLPLGKHLDTFVELLHVDSKRNSRALAGDRARQIQTIMQTSFRFKF
jgi:hypothetical protein